jgi:hypothetical protein
MKNILTSEQIATIKKAIDNELRIRCINTDTTLTEKDNKLVMTSTPFNTIPVLHSPITINIYGASIHVQDKEYTSNLTGETLPYVETSIYASVHASYEGNGVELFNVHITFTKEGYRTHDDITITNRIILTRN